MKSEWKCSVDIFLVSEVAEEMKNHSQDGWNLPWLSDSDIGGRQNNARYWVYGVLSCYNQGGILGPHDVLLVRLSSVELSQTNSICSSKEKYYS